MAPIIYYDDDDEEQHEETFNEMISEKIMATKTEQQCYELYDFIKSSDKLLLTNYVWPFDQCKMNLINLLVEYKHNYKIWNDIIIYLVDECNVNPFELSCDPLVSTIGDDSQTIKYDMIPEKFNIWKEHYEKN